MTLIEALEAALEYARHSEGCSAKQGDQYRCRCRWRELEPQIREALEKSKRSLAVFIVEEK